MTPPKGEEEVVLVERARAGDRGAFWALMTKYEQPIYGFCFRMLLNRQSAEDVAADTFLRGLDRIHQLRAPEAFRSWLFTIAR